jgi:hypothetical protein
MENQSAVIRRIRVYPRSIYGTRIYADATDLRGSNSFVRLCENPSCAFVVKTIVNLGHEKSSINSSTDLLRNAYVLHPGKQKHNKGSYKKRHHPGLSADPRFLQCFRLHPDL